VNRFVNAKDANRVRFEPAELIRQIEGGLSALPPYPKKRCFQEGVIVQGKNVDFPLSLGFLAQVIRDRQKEGPVALAAPVIHHVFQHHANDSAIQLSKSLSHCAQRRNLDIILGQEAKRTDLRQDIGEPVDWAGDLLEAGYATRIGVFSDCSTDWFKIMKKRDTASPPHSTESIADSFGDVR
jgi:hypothetical protein